MDHGVEFSRGGGWVKADKGGKARRDNYNSMNNKTEEKELTSRENNITLHSKAV